MKRFRRPCLALLLIDLILIIPPVPSWGGGGDYPRGDLNQDRFIDEADVDALVDILLERYPYPGLIPEGDFNQDGTVDIADALSIGRYDGDWDDDGIPDFEDEYPMDPENPDRGLADYKLDTDDDGYAEGIDLYRVDGAAVLMGGSSQDSDGDGILNSEEETGWTNGSGGPFITDSLLKDTDRDGMEDGVERTGGTNPLDPDTDGDGVLDGDDGDPLNPSVTAPAGKLFDSAGNPRAPRRLTPEQIRINREWQAGQEALRDEWRKAVSKAAVAGKEAPTFAKLAAAAGSSGRGLGFQGPQAVGSNFDSVQSDKFSGAFSYSIPIKVPPGRGGFEPDLMLLYRSTNSHSWLGQGWDLNPGRIERSTKDGPPKYDRIGNFVWKTRPGIRGEESMADHPVGNVSWHGAAAFCNWLSEKEGLTPCYDLSTWELAIPFPNGYRLPTEAEWERAAAWDGSRHWIYGYTSDTLAGYARCNYESINPIGFSSEPFTSPVGWYNGVNMIPNGATRTVHSVSPVGCYDMTGNIGEWVHDWIGNYSSDPQTNPTGPADGTYRGVRGGIWQQLLWPSRMICRTAMRISQLPEDVYAPLGFRLAASGATVSDMVDVPAGSFTMGRTGAGDDAIYGWPGEDPRHQVTLSAYQIGKHEVTNRQYAEVLNWALKKGYLEGPAGEPYAGGDVYKGGKVLIAAASSECQIGYDPNADPPHDGDPFTPLDNPDRFVYKTSAGGMELVFSGEEEIDGEMCRVYHVEVDSGSLVRFIYHPNPDNPAGGSWQAWWKDGKKAFFNQDSSTTDTVIAGPSGEVFSWGVEREEDLHGNAIEYRYAKSEGSWQQYMHLESIGYNFVDGEPMVEIAFEVSARSDVNGSWASYRESYRSGFQTASDRFLTGITETVKRRGDVYAGHPERVRRYEIKYHDLDALQGRTISCLASVQEFGETDAEAFPPITMEYSEVLPGASWGTASAAYDCPPQWDGTTFPPATEEFRYNLPINLGVTSHGYDNGLKFADYNRDGLLDFIYRFYDAQWYQGVYINNPDLPSGWEGSTDGSHPYAAPHGFVWNSSSWPSFVYGNFVGDLNGDAYPDIAWKFSDGGTDNTHLAINSATGWEYDQSWNTSYNLPLELNDPRWRADYGARLADYNGDGLTDYVRSFENKPDPSASLSDAFLNTGYGWSDPSTAQSYRAPHPFTYYISSSVWRDFGNFAGDLNGDGLTDLAWYWGDAYLTGGNAGENYLAINSGRTSGAEGNSWRFYGDRLSHYYKIPRPLKWVRPSAPNDPVDAGARFADVNGDGLIDILYHFGIPQPWSWYYLDVYLNTGSGWQRGDIAYLPTHHFASLDPRDVPLSFIGDIDGDGMTDVLSCWRNYRDSPPLHSSRCIHKGQKPNLLTRIDNGIGGTVDVKYTPSTKGWMKLYDPATGQVEVNEGVPFVMHLVSKITRTGLHPNNINPSNPVTTGTTSQSSTTLYRYAAGKYLDREFRGFGKVKEIEAETGNFMITEFYQDYARRGRVKSDRAYVGHRADYRVAGVLDGDTLEPKDEHVPVSGEPRLVAETNYRYRVVIHEDDPLHLKTFTDTNTKLGLDDFPRGMTLVTPACTLSKVYEYSGNYTKLPQDLDDSQIVATAKEMFYDGRGNLVEEVDFGQVTLIDPGATLSGLAQPRLDITFQNGVGDPDGRVSKMTGYDTRRLDTWMDVPVATNTSGYYTRDLVTGARETQDIRLLEASRTDYDYRNRPVLKTRALDNGPDPVTRSVYDDYGNVETVIDARGNATVTDYDPIYHTFPATVTNALGHVEEYVVDPGSGNLLGQTDANGNEVTASYDGLGRITGRTNTKGFEVVSYDYGFWEEVPSATGVYLPSRIRTTAWTPNGPGRAGVWSEKHYDGLGREYQELRVGQRGEANPIRIVTEFSDRGSAWKRSHPHWLSEAGSAHWSYEFLENDDGTIPAGEKTWKRMGLNRPVETRHELTAAMTASSLTLYESPLSRKITDARGNQHRQLKDGFDNLIGVWEPDDAGTVGVPLEPQGRLTRYGWDAAGRLEFVRRHVDKDQYSAADPITNVVCDSLGRMTRLNDPDTGVSLYEYDGTGNLTVSIDARGMAATREYDDLGRLLRLAYPDVVSGASLEHVYTYDRGVGENLVGRVGRVESPGCDTVFSYDTGGNLLLKRRTIDGATYDVLGAYDDADRMTEMTYPDGMRLGYAYDPVTQSLDRVTDPDSGQVWLADVEMSRFGQANLFALGNGVARHVEFDWTGRANRLLTDSVAGTLSDLRYTFDANSNISRIQELAGPTPRGDMNYRYDPLNRLTAAYGTTMSGESAGDQLTPRFGYRYDPLGRMTYNSRFLNPSYNDYVLEYEYSTDPRSDRPAHGVQSIRFTKAGVPAPVYAHNFYYDDAGNLVGSTNGVAALAGTNDLDRSYVWDALGRLTSLIAASGTTSFAYDHSKQRVKKTGPSGESVIYIGDIAEITSAGMTKHIFAGPIRVATVQPDGRKLFTMTDHLHSSTIITDEAGSVVQRMDYEPYGNLIENARSGNPAGIRHTYTGQEDDFGTGLMYYGARYYDPVVGMFTSADILTRQPDEPQMFLRPDLFVTDHTDPQRFNRYAYCANNPMVYTDDTGEFAFLTAILIGAAIGAIISAAAATIQIGIQYGFTAEAFREHWSDIAISAGIGALAGAVGAGAGGGVMSAMLSRGASHLAAGIVSGAVGGAASGLVSGAAGMIRTGIETGNWAQGAANLGIDVGLGALFGGIGGAFAGKSLGSALSKSKAIGTREALMMAGGAKPTQQMARRAANVFLRQRSWGRIASNIAGGMAKGGSKYALGRFVFDDGGNTGGPDWAWGSW